MAAFETYTKTFPKDEEGWLVLGEMLHEEHKIEEAMKAYEEVTKLNPKHKTAYYHLANLFLIKNSREKKPGFDMANFMTARDKPSQKEEVEERYEKAIEMDPENVEAYYNRAWVARQYVLKMDSRITTEECSKYSL